MNLLADESVDQPVIDRLRQDGHVVLAVTEMEPSISDEAVLAMANQHKALLLTVDKNFGELVFRQQHISEGVILIRLAGLSRTSKARVVSAVINDHADELGQAFTVISPGMVRIRLRR